MLATFTHTPAFSKPDAVASRHHQACFDPSSLNSLRPLVLLYSQYECTNYRHSIGRLQGLQPFFPSMGVVSERRRGQQQVVNHNGCHHLLVIVPHSQSSFSSGSQGSPKYTPATSKINPSSNLFLRCVTLVNSCVVRVMQTNNSLIHI